MSSVLNQKPVVGMASSEGGVISATSIKAEKQEEDKNAKHFFIAPRPTFSTHLRVSASRPSVPVRFANYRFATADGEIAEALERDFGKRKMVQKVSEKEFRTYGQTKEDAEKED